MIRQELKKIFKNKYIWIFMIIFLFLNSYTTYDIYKYNNIRFTKKDLKDYNKEYKEIYIKYKGLITNDKVEDIQKKLLKKNIGGVEEAAYNDILKNIEYNYFYEKDMSLVIIRAKQNCDLYQKKRNMYELKKNQNIIKLYKDRDLKYFHNMDGYEALIKHDSSSMFIILLLMLGCIPIFIKEKTTKMNYIIKTTIKGRKNSTLCKIIASMLYTIFISNIFFASDIINHNFFYYMDGLNDYLYSIELFKFTPLNWPIWKYLILMFGLKILCFLFIDFVVLFFTSIFSETLLPCLGSVIFIGGLLYTNDLINGNIGQIIYDFNPCALLTNRTNFENYTVFNLLNQPLDSIMIISFICFIVIIILFICIVILNKKENIIKKNYIVFVTNKLKRMFQI